MRTAASVSEASSRAGLDRGRRAPSWPALPRALRAVAALSHAPVDTWRLSVVVLRGPGGSIARSSSTAFWRSDLISRVAPKTIPASASMMAARMRVALIRGRGSPAVVVILNDPVGAQVDDPAGSCRFERAGR